MPNPPKNNHIASTERYKSNMEKRKEIYKNKKTSIAAVKKKIISKRRCTFCKEEGHKITCCPVIGSVGIPWEDGDKLIKFITDESPFRVGHFNEVDNIMKNMKWTYTKHLKIHLILSSLNHNNVRPGIEYLFAKISCFDSIGGKVIGFCPCYVPLNDLITQLYKIKNVKGRLLFCSVKEESVGDEFVIFQRNPNLSGMMVSNIPLLLN